MRAAYIVAFRITNFRNAFSIWQKLCFVFFFTCNIFFYFCYKFLLKQNIIVAYFAEK